MEPVGNIESPLREVFQQNTGLHTYRDHTLVPYFFLYHSELNVQGATH